MCYLEASASILSRMSKPSQDTATRNALTKTQAANVISATAEDERERELIRNPSLTSACCKSINDFDMSCGHAVP